MPNKKFVVFAESDNLNEFQVEINSMLDDGFDLYGQHFSDIKGHLFQAMIKTNEDENATSSEGYDKYINEVDERGITKPYVAPPITKDRANG
jgi:hypothetical protein